MTDSEKSHEIANKNFEWISNFVEDNNLSKEDRNQIRFKIYSACQEMAEWKEQQMMELWNVARNVYEAWMGGTMNDVRECMKDLGHIYDEFKDKGMY